MSGPRVAAVIGGAWREPAGSVGGAISIELARRGFHVSVADLDEGGATVTAGMIHAEGGAADVVVGDAGTLAGCEAIRDEILGRHDRLDVLVNNIGIGAGGDIVHTTESDWDSVLTANVKAAALMCRAAIPVMPRGGAIVNTSSISAFTPGEHATYTVSKAAVEGLTRVVAYQHGRDGIRVNAVRVGEVATWRVLQGLDEDAAADLRARRRARTVLGTQGESWDIARAVAFLVSDDARWITGQVLTVDGGASLKRGELWPEAQ
jgi:NAD(P)-dependent dehydrogenase (short-subunit alcohol dehydrogenase family)